MRCFIGKGRIKFLFPLSYFLLDAREAIHSTALSVSVTRRYLSCYYFNKCNHYMNVISREVVNVSKGERAMMTPHAMPTIVRVMSA